MSPTWRAERKSSGRSSTVIFVSTVLVAAILGIVLPDMLAASGMGGGGGGRGGGGFGIGIMIGPSGPPVEEPNWDKMEKDLKREPGASEKPRGESAGTTGKAKTVAKTPVDVAPARKLAKPRVPYLTELAMDIDKTLMELATNEPVKAVQLYRNALAQAKKKGDARGEMEAFTSLGYVYYLTGQLQRAKEDYEGALAISRQLKDAMAEAVTLRNLAAVFIASGNYDYAEEQSAEALKKFREGGNLHGVRMILNNVGVLEKNRGRHREAMEAYEQALAADKEQGRLLVLTLNNMGNLSRSWGEYKNALDYFSRAQEMAKAMGDSEAEGEVLLSIGRVYSEWGLYEQALVSSQQALGVFAKIGAPTDWDEKIVGDLYLDLGRLDQAEHLLKKAEYDSSLGRLYLMKSEPDRAKNHYELLMEASQKAGNLDELLTAYTGLGKAFEAAKKYKQAETYYSKGLDITEEIRSSLLPSERKNFFEAKLNGFARSEPAKGLIRVMLKQQKAAQSIFPSEAIRARGFADNLSQRVDGTYFNVPKEIVAKELEIANRLASAKTALSIVPKAVDNERFADMSRQIKALETERNSFVQSLRRDHKDYASAKYPKPVKLEEASIGSDEYVVIFDLLGEGLGVKIIKGKKIVNAFFMEWNVNELERQVASFRKSFEKADLRGFSPELASALHKKLLGVALERIPAGSPVTIIPDGMLALLPFETLVAAGKAEWKKGKWGDQPEGLTYVGDLYPLTYYQSLTAMTLVRTLGMKRKPGDRILVVADPVFEMSDMRAQASDGGVRVAQNENSRSIPLMAAIEEDSGGSFKLPRLSKTSDLAKNLEELYGSNSEIYTGLASRKSTFLSKVAPHLDDYKSVVFATHGFASNQIPGIMEPVLALTMVPYGTDGFLTMTEVAGLKMNADVAALTACQTGTGIKLAGEGIMSMGRAFQSAGAKSVLMSLWSVSENSSVILMEEFFKHLKGGKSKRDAWTLARADVRKAGFEHPFFWGAFILVGEAD